MNAHDITTSQKEILKLYTKLIRSSNIVTEKMHRHLTERKLTLSQFGVLEALYSLGPMSQKTIGEKILKSSGNITLVIDNLEKRELVRRERDVCDRRCFTIQLTDEGFDLIRTIFPKHARTAERVFSVLNPDEQQTLAGLLKKLGTAGSNDNLGNDSQNDQ
jgi:MarR family transcriptional regulator, 2-MHQ and catechol-resistance regulon repressor